MLALIATSTYLSLKALPVVVPISQLSFPKGRNQRMLKSCCHLVLFCAIAAASSGAQAVGHRAKISVTVQADAELEGTAYDSLRVRPLASAKIFLEGASSRSTITDSLGRFRIEFLAPGKYRARLIHPSLDSLGISIVTPEFDVPKRRLVMLRVDIPSARTVLQRRCDIRGVDPARFAILGRVFDGASLQPIPSVNVAARDQVTLEELSSGKMARVSATSDTFGRFALCALPINEKLTLFAGNDSVGSIGPITDASPIVTRDIVVSTGPRPSAVARNVNGLVTTPAGQPIEGIIVRLLASRASTVTDAKGHFALSPTKSQDSLEARGIGYQPKRLPVALTAENDSVTISLEPFVAGTLLAPVIVTEDAKQRVLADVGFTRRMKHSGGHFITYEEIQKKHRVHIVDVIRGIPGITASIDKYGDDVVTSNRSGGSVLSDTHGCVQYLIDGVAWGLGSFLRSGGSPPPSTGSGGGFALSDPGKALDMIAAKQAKDLDASIGAKEILGIEIYQGPNTPAQFNGGGGNCATVVIWTLNSAR